MNIEEQNMNFVGVAPVPKTVLDIGAHAGQASKQFVKPGDKWILVDNQQYLQYDRWSKIEQIEDAEYHVCDALEYKTPADVVVCSNVVYHVLDPHALLKHLKYLTLDALYLTTYYDEPRPEPWKYYGAENPCHPHPETAATIFWRPTIQGLEDELKELGFKIVSKTVGGDMVSFTCKVKE